MSPAPFDDTIPGDANIPRDVHIPRDAGGPVFAEPWQARAFAVVVRLCRDGHVEWDAFRLRLMAEIAAADSAGDTTTGYYEHWLAACEALLAARGMAEAGDLAARQVDIAAHRPPPTTAVANPVAIDRGSR